MNSEDLIYHAKTALNAGKYNEALQLFDEILSNDPENPDAWFGKAEVLVSLEKFNESIEAYDKAFELNPQNLDCLLNKGSVFLYLNDLIQANDVLKKLNEIDREYIPTWFFKLQVLGKEQKIDEFKESVEKIFQISENYPKAKYSDKVGKYPPIFKPSINYYVDDVLEYRVWVHPVEGTGDFFYAFEYYAAAISFFIDPEGKDKFSMVEPPIALVSQKQFLPIPKLEVIKEEIPDKIFEIRAENVLKRLRSSKFNLTDFMDCSSDNPAKLVQCGKLYLELSNSETAMEYFNRVLRKHPGYFSALWYKSYALWMMNKYDEAALYFEKTLESNPRDYGKYSDQELIQWQASIHAYRGYMLLSIKKYEEALSDFDAATAFNPSSYEYLLYKAEVLEKLDKKEESEECIKKASLLRDNKSIS